MGRLHVEAEQTARTAPQEVWALVSDATRYPQIVADLVTAAEQHRGSPPPESD